MHSRWLLPLIPVALVSMLAVAGPRSFSGSPWTTPAPPSSSSSSTYTSTQSDGGPAFVVQTGGKICLNGASCSQYLAFDGGSIGLVGAELDVPSGFTDSQKVNADTDIGPHAVIVQAGDGEYGYRALNNSRWDVGTATNDYFYSQDGIIKAFIWDFVQVGTTQLNPNTTSGINRTTYVGDGFELFALEVPPRAPRARILEQFPPPQATTE